MVDPHAWEDTVLLLVCPNWDCNTAEGHEALEQYPTALLIGLKGGGKNPINMSKVTEATQEPNGIAAKFYGGLCEAYQLYSPFDPEAPKN